MIGDQATWRVPLVVDWNAVVISSDYELESRELTNLPDIYLSRWQRVRVEVANSPVSTAAAALPPVAYSIA